MPVVEDKLDVLDDGSDITVGSNSLSMLKGVGLSLTGGIHIGSIQMQIVTLGDRFFTITDWINPVYGHRTFCYPVKTSWFPDQGISAIY